MANDVPPETPRDVLLLLLDEWLRYRRAHLNGMWPGPTKDRLLQHVEDDRAGWLARYDAAVAREK